MAKASGQSASDQTLNIQSQLVNRHGLIAGATGTGKTVTLQSFAQALSDQGVPVFMADVKGDLSGIAAAGAPNEKMTARLQERGLKMPAWSACPVMFWDPAGKAGHPIRTTISEMGPELLGRLMNLNEVQASVLQVVFKIADEGKLLLLDLKDLTSMLKFISENLTELKATYGHLSPASVGAIQRGLLTLEQQGVGSIFGEPAFDMMDLIQTDSRGKGYINVLVADKLIQSSSTYSTLLIWLLSELFENLPEVGDLEKPKLVFIFDEAHLLFKDAPKAFVEKIEQVVRLIRSKGVGVYFVTQNPLDIPETVLGQLSNRVQHALRAFTPADQKAVKVAAQTLRPNPAFKAEQAITELNVGEALVSFLDKSGAPEVVQRAWILPPGSQLGPLSPEARSAIIAGSPVAGHYEKSVDRESAFEILSQRQAVANPVADQPSVPTAASQTSSVLQELLFGSVGPRGGRKAGLLEKAATSAVRSASSSVGREIIRGVLGSILGGGGRGGRR